MGNLVLGPKDGWVEIKGVYLAPDDRKELLEAFRTKDFTTFFFIIDGEVGTVIAWNYFDDFFVRKVGKKLRIWVHLPDRKRTRVKSGLRDLIEALVEIYDNVSTVGAHDCPGFDCFMCLHAKTLELAANALEKAGLEFE